MMLKKIMLFLVLSCSGQVTFTQKATLELNSPENDTIIYSPDWEGNLASDLKSWMTGWTNASQATEGSVRYEFRDGNLRLWTDSGTYQRPKVRSNSENYRTGTYLWRVYVPAMELNSQVSVGAFLWCDDGHELDFEIGSGQEAVRRQYNAQDDEVLMYLTSQANPWHQSIHPIKSERWYDVAIVITETKDKHYKVRWLLDGKVMDTAIMQYGKKFPFGIYCSLENLKFIGDHPSTREHYTLFNKVGFYP